MGIPEHSKCVRVKKRIRYTHQYGNWKKYRAIKRRKGLMFPKERIRQIIRAEFMIRKSKIKNRFGNYTEHMKDILGQNYKRYGKYDD